MKQYEMKKQDDNDPLVQKLMSSARQDRTPEEKTARRSSW